MDKNAEVLVCGASIMKDVWEIRLREYRQKRQMEEERIRRSALERINQDWHARMSSKIKTLKRLERKAKLPEEPTLDAQKAKKTHLGRPQGFQSSRVQRQMDTTKTTKPSKLALLRHLNENCPGLMVWAKSWKFSQPFPKPEENPFVVDWGQSWKFLNLQPNTESKPWCDLGFDANNNINTNDVFLWEKLCKSLNSECIQQDLVTAEWEKSWKFSQGREPNEGTNNCANKIEEKCYKLWGESAPEWQESWKSMKHGKEAEIRMDIQPSANEEKQSECPWNHSWMYFKKQLHTSNNLAWKESWRVAKTISRPETNSVQFQAAVPEEMLPDICNMIMNMSREMKHTIEFGKRDVQPSEWEKSWKTIKNQSEYKEEINKAEVEVKIETQKPDNSKHQAERVKFDILALPKSQKQEMLHFPKQMDWSDSWKILKRHCGEERGFRNLRCPLQQLPTQTLNEWTNSWRFTNLTLNQEAGLWEQGWSTNTQPRPIRRVQENENFPHNGPAAVRVWSESWRSTRRQHLAERQGASASAQPICRHAYARSVADWDQSWKSSTHNHHDRPSMTDWADSWRFSNSEDLQPEYTWFGKSMEIKERICKTSNAFCRHMDSQDWNDSWRVKKKVDGLTHLMKNEVLDWDNSWMFSSTAFYQRQGEIYSNFQLESDVRNNAMLKSVQMECSSEWGRSWKMSNPQPPKNTASWVDAKPFNAQNNALMLWSKHKHINYLPSALVNDPELKIWSKSWRFVKMDVDSNLRGESVKTTKSAAVMCLNIDQQKPQEKRWSDACKIAKMQTKRNTRSKSSHNEDEDENETFAEWIESWKFSNNLKSLEPATVSVSLGNWKNSWKFLLESYAPVNGPKTSKSR